MRRHRFVGTVTALLLVVGMELGAHAAAATPSVPRPDHVVIVVEENHSAPGVLGNPDAPFINSLAAQGANFTQSFAETHPSQPNYIALFSGSTNGVTDDNCPYSFSTDSLGSELIASGQGFAGYSEDMPSVGYTGCSSGAYVRKHNPWVDFSSVPASANQPFTAFPTDYSTLPAVSFVMPNLNNDMHNGTIAQGDTWLQQNLGGYITWAKTHNSLFILTFDEDDGSDSNQIPTIITGQPVVPGSYNETINHYNVLRTIEDAYGLAPLGASATAAPILDIWRSPATPPPGSGSVGFVGASASSSSGTTARVVAPGGIGAGDTELLFVSTDQAGVTTSPPSGLSGWTMLRRQTSGTLETTLFSRVAQTGDAAATVSVALASWVKTDLQFADYSGVSAAALTVTGASDTATAQHTTPAVTVTDTGSWVVSYWADRSSATTAWTVPTAVTTRKTSLGTGGGRVTTVLADSGAPTPTGTYPALTATTNAVSGRGATLSIVLSPAA